MGAAQRLEAFGASEYRRNLGMETCKLSATDRGLGLAGPERPRIRVPEVG